MIRTPISIIIPTYNRSHIIGQTIDSIIAQTYKDWECLVVDDGSTDMTKELMMFFCEKDRRIQLHHRPLDWPKGANACRNHGIKNCNGDFIIFFDSDDLMAPDCLENRMNFFKKHPEMDMLVFSMGIFKEGFDLKLDTNRIVTNLNLEETIEKFILSYKIPWQVSRPIIRREILNNGIRFNERMQNFQDDEFFIKLLKCSRPKYLSIDITDSYYRDDGRKYSSILDNQNIIDSLFEFYSTVFEVLNKEDLQRVRNKLIFKFYDQIFGYYRSNNNLKAIGKTISLFNTNMRLTLEERFVFYTLIVLNKFYYDKKGYYFVTKKMKRMMFRKNNLKQQ